MRVIFVAIAVLVLRATPSFSSPTPVGKALRARNLAVEDPAVHARAFIPLVARKKKAAASSSSVATTPATATPAAEAPGATASDAAAIKVVKIGEEASEKIKTNGFFGTPNGVRGGFVFTKVLLPANVVGGIEPEYNSSVANSITVVPKMASIPPPTGMVYVDPLTFLISTASPPTTGDTMKVDYIFTEATKLAVDPNQVAIGKLDAATNQFITQGVGEFEFEKDENEWSLTVADMNGEWAILAPETAVLPATARED
ncbi:hypothetical protein GQ53DRAFT_769671 [Thozetella sp. PMI_491]|nr:hypothetical protein GQ53DRAFT_769671 [Thozetella sp. PMI_491]